MAAIHPLVWLILGGLLRLFDFGRWAMPVAVWLAPVFLLRFAHLSDPIIVAVAIWLTIFLAALVAYRGVIPVPGPAYPFMLALFATTWTLPYVVDRLLFSQLPGYVSTLIFPVTWVVVELITARLSPFGTWGSIAYTQYGVRPLMQLASVTGLSGITFLVTWFGSTVVWAWDHQFEWEVIQGGLLIYGLIWGLVLIGGTVRLAFGAQSERVRIAAIGWPSGILDAKQVMSAFMPQTLSDDEREMLRRAFGKIQDYFLEASKREAQAGADMIVWPEINLLVFREDEDSFMERAKQLASEAHIYLLMGMGTIRPGDAKPMENKSVLMAPSGEVVLSHTKAIATPGIEAMYQVRGDGRIRWHDSSYGRIASPICYEMDFPAYIRQVGQARVDILLVPASDVESIKQLHHVMAVFRAIENGTSMVRATRWGLSTVVDPLGRALITMNDLALAQRALVAQVPTAGVRTVYTRVGDLFAWSCAAGLLAATAWALSFS